MRLLTRTTRNVATTEAGERLLSELSPNFEGIDAALASLSELREKPGRTLRITTGEHAATTILWPVLRKLLPDYPDIHVEVMTDSALTDIVAERFDAGIRLGEQLAKDMIAVRIGPPMRRPSPGQPAISPRVRSCVRRAISPVTIASISVSSPMVASMHGNSSRAATP